MFKEAVKKYKNEILLYINKFLFLYSLKLQVNLDILFPKMPCAMLTVDIQDIVGSHSLDLGGQLYKRSLDKNGNYISDQLHVFFYNFIISLDFFCSFIRFLIMGTMIMRIM